ncbi:hypothetical protein GCM10009578_091990 [Streptomyces rhizosphaericus]|uniref:hypothetical protein n=1 Tax=Streptomyces rhizosphaericus TaxID=114699 RepID=UPI0031CEF3D2
MKAWFETDVETYLAKAKPLEKRESLEVWARDRRMATVYKQHEETPQEMRERAGRLARSYSGQVIEP